MSLFPHSVFSSDFPRFPTGEFTPLFRLLDDYASHQLSRNGDGAAALKTFQPKFDVKENKDSYELHGELPGIDQKDVHIEFSDSTTLVVKGRTDRHSESGTPPAGLLETTQEPAKITEAGEDEHEPEHYHKPTVEDESTVSGGNGESTPSSATSTNQLAQTGATQQQVQPKKQQTSHYWISERSIGEFHRSFSFPSRIDQDSVKASLKNGILSIIVPKSQAPTTRRINIE